MPSLEIFDLDPSPVSVALLAIGDQLTSQLDKSSNRLCLTCPVAPVSMQTIPNSSQTPCAQIWYNNEIKHIESSARAYITSVDTVIDIWFYMHYLPNDNNLGAFRQAYLDRMIKSLMHPQSKVTGQDGLVTNFWWGFQLFNDVNDIKITHVQSIKMTDGIYVIDPPLYVSVASMTISSKSDVELEKLQEVLTQIGS